jgi:hypothetical protein
MIKSRRIRREGHVARMEEMINTKFGLEDLKGSDHLGDLG